MSHGIDGRPGKELGLTGPYADTPAFQIVNDTHDLLLALTSRLIDLEYGRYAEAFKRHPSWPTIDKERSGLAGRLSALGSDAVLAAQLTEEIRRLDEKVSDLVAAVNSEGAA